MTASAKRTGNVLDEETGARSRRSRRQLRVCDGKRRRRQVRVRLADCPSVTTLDEDQPYFLSISHEVVVGSVFLLQTS